MRKSNSLDQPLVNPHLKGIPSLTTLTTRCLSRRDLEVLRWKAHWALHAEVLALGTLDELSAHFLERADFLRCEGDADLVDLWLVALRRLLWVLERHVGGDSTISSGCK